MFKYMAIYSMTQYFTILILYSVGSLLGDWQFLWIDMFIILPIVLSSNHIFSFLEQKIQKKLIKPWFHFLNKIVGRTEASDILTKERPTETLISASVIISLLGQILLMVCFQLSIWAILITSSWYIPADPYVSEKLTSTMAVSVLFTFSSFQYIVVIFGLSVSKPFRRHFFSNCK